MTASTETTSNPDLERYSRQMRFFGIGEAGQKKLAGARVLLCGVGALGTVLANTLARAGVGFIRLVDRDFVELSNLQRQVLFDEEDVRSNTPKAEAAATKLRQINSQVTYELSSPISTAQILKHSQQMSTSLPMGLTISRSAISSMMSPSNRANHGCTVAASAVTAKP